MDILKFFLQVCTKSTIESRRSSATAAHIYLDIKKAHSVTAYRALESLGYSLLCDRWVRVLTIKDRKDDRFAYTKGQTCTSDVSFLHYNN